MVRRWLPGQTDTPNCTCYSLKYCAPRNKPVVYVNANVNRLEPMLSFLLPSLSHFKPPQIVTNKNCAVISSSRHPLRTPTAVKCRCTILASLTSRVITSDWNVVLATLPTFKAILAQQFLILNTFHSEQKNSGRAFSRTATWWLATNVREDRFRFSGSWMKGAFFKRQVRSASENERLW